MSGSGSAQHFGDGVGEMGVATRSRPGLGGGNPGLQRRGSPRARPSGRSEAAAQEPANGKSGRRHNVERPQNVNTPGRAARHVRSGRCPRGQGRPGHPGAAAHWKAPEPPRMRYVSTLPCSPPSGHSAPA